MIKHGKGAHEESCLKGKKKKDLRKIHLLEMQYIERLKVQQNISSYFVHRQSPIKIAKFWALFTFV